MASEEGFTLLECLIALAILAVGSATLYGAGADLLRTQNHISQIDRAVLLASSKLDEIAALHGPLPQTSTGTYPGEDIRWTLNAKAIPGPLQAHIVLQDVHLELTWQDGINRRSLEVDTRHLGAVRP